MKRRHLGALSALALFACPAVAKPPAHAGCGTSLVRATEEMYLHRRAELKRGPSPALRARALASAAASTNRDFGNIATIDDAAGAVGQRNDFNLNQQTVAFVPSTADASRYRIQVSGGSYDSAVAASATRLDGLGDDDSRQIRLPFAFPFFGVTYRDVWVNSDGNLTFTAKDDTTNERSLGRMVAGPPRISPLFADLDPSIATSPAGVRVLADLGRVVISWQAVPVYLDYSNGAPQTFQVRLFGDGRIEFAFSSVNLSDGAVTGIAPGAMKGAVSVVSLASGPDGEFSGTVADRFTTVPAVDIAIVAQKFYSTHEDAYDYLVIYNAANVLAASSAVAYEVTVRNQGAGFGLPAADIGAEFGSNRRLQSVLNMGPLSQYPNDPNGIVPSRGPTGDTVLSVLAHETGHRFLAFASVSDPHNPSAPPMLGRALVHWSFNFNSEASFLEGNRIQDKGEGTSPRFLTTATVQQYSPLDQYLMGFRAAEEVPPTFFVTYAPDPANRFPEVGVSFDGVRQNATIDDLVAAVGRRTPDYTVAQRRFRFGFILVVPAGRTPPADQIAKVEAIRAAFEDYYAKGTSNRASADTGLKRTVQLSSAPAAGVVVGSTGSATLTLDAPADKAQTFTLVTTGFVQAPASVTIPAGASQVLFALRGLAEGVDQLTATPSDSSFETSVARVQVKAEVSGLSLILLSADPAAVTPGVTLAPVQVRAVDINRLPYSGVRVNAATADGALDHVSAVTNESGIATFLWTTTSTTGVLALSIDGAPNAAVTVSLTGHPVLDPNGVVNAASYVPGITPGSLATLFGAGLSGGATGSTQGVQVLVNGEAASLTYVSDTQMNMVVPADVTGSTAALEIDNPAGRFTGYTAAIKPIAPGIFEGEGNTAAVLIAGTGLTTFARPARAHDTVEIYLTGLPAGSPMPQVLIGNVPATVIAGGMLAQFPGVYQINATLGPGTPSGDQPIVVIAGGVRSNEPLVRIQ